MSFAFLLENMHMHRPAYDPDSFYHWHTIETRFRDLDPLNHANNAVFNTYFEEARIHFVHQISEFRDSYQQGKAFVLVKCTIEYLKPVLYPSKLLIGSSILKIGNSSLEAIQAIYDSETKQLLSVAIPKGVWFDIKANRPSRIPELTDLKQMMFATAQHG